MRPNGDMPPPMRAATAGTAGRRGIVPRPPAGSQTKFLRGDGTFQAITGGGDMLIANNLGEVDKPAARANLGIGSGDTPAFNGLKIGSYTPAAYVGVGGNRGTMNFHGFEDWTVTDSTASPNLGYAAFDAKPTINGSAANSHLVGFQSRPIYDGSGSIDDYFEAFGTYATHTGTGLIAYARGLHIRDVSGTGPITSNIGLLIDAITRGTAANYAIYSTAGQNYFGGPINAAGGFTGNVGLGVTQANAPAQLTMTGSILSSEGTGIFQNLYYSGGWKYNANGFGSGIYQGGGNGNLLFVTVPSNAGGAGAAAAPVTQMTLLNGGGLEVAGSVKGTFLATTQTPTAAAAVASTHKVGIVLNGTTFYMLLTNVP